jgi:hypothetical protein
MRFNYIEYNKSQIKGKAKVKFHRRVGSHPKQMLGKWPKVFREATRALTAGGVSIVQNDQPVESSSSVQSISVVRKIHPSAKEAHSVSREDRVCHKCQLPDKRAAWACVLTRELHERAYSTKEWRTRE